MHLPTAFDLRLRENLVPTDDIVDHLVPCLHAVDEYERKATVTVTYSVSFDQELQKLVVETSVKSKRPVKVDRNEERLGDDIVIFAAVREIEGQQRDPWTPAPTTELANEVRKLDDKLKAQGSSITIESPGGAKATLGAKLTDEEPAYPVEKAPAKPKAKKPTAKKAGKSKA